MFEKILNGYQFSFRRNYLGKLKIRSGLPYLVSDQNIENEILYYTQLLKTGFSETESAKIKKVIDIGCRNWSYARALADVFRNSDLMGVELDGWRRYWNFYRRIDYAEAYAQQLRAIRRNAHAVLGDFQEMHFELGEGPVLFCFLFPFVTEYPCLKWGLPARYSNFSKLIKHARQLAQNQQTESLIFSVHQGIWEAEKVREIYQELKISVTEKFLSPEAWKGIWPSPHENWIFMGRI